MPVAYFCFVVASLAALGGMSLGVWMGMSENFTLAPAHAHLNLLGWVTMSLYGLYHRGVEHGDLRPAWMQVSCGAAGFLLLAGGLGVMLVVRDPRVVPVILLGAALCLISMLLFLTVVLMDATRFRVHGLTAARARSSVS